MTDDPVAELSRLTEELRAAHEEIEQLKVGLVTRHRIGVAQGLLMLRYGISMEAAFEYLSRRSQTENVKLHDIAQQVVEESAAFRWTQTASGIPAPLPDEQA